MGSSQYHFYIYEQLLRVPGIVVIHDLVMAGIFEAQIASIWRDREGWKQFLRLAEGEVAVKEYETIAHKFAAAHQEAFESFLSKYLLLKPMIESSIAQIVHMDEAAAQLQQRYSSANPHVVYQGVADPYAERNAESRDTIRERLHLSANAFVIAVMGIVNPEKRLPILLEAIDQLRNQPRELRLVIVGAEVFPDLKQTLRRLIRRLNLTDVTRITGHVGWQTFNDYLIACDVVVNLRYPSRMQMSAIILRALAAGKPVVITNLPEWSFLPENVCLRVPSGTNNELPSLLAQLRRLMEDTDHLQQLSRQARTYYQEHYSVVAMAEGYLRVIEEVVQRKVLPQGTYTQYSLEPYQKRFERTYHRRIALGNYTKRKLLRLAGIIRQRITK
jgi:glycosyltransferase involved in cell wall biosynthesis